MAAQFVDPFGYPVTSYGGGGGGKLYEVTRQSYRAKHPQQEQLVNPTHKLVNYYDWRTIVSASRNLVANFPILEGAITTKTMHTVGRAWDPVFEGEDKAWGELAENWLEDEFYKLASVRGENFDLKTSLYLASIAIDTDGDFGLILTETDGGYPKLQFLTADRIGQRDCDPLVKKGPYKGYRIELGIIYSEYGAPIAFNILGGEEKDDVQVNAKDFVFKFDPRFFDQGRGLPSMRGSLMFIDKSRTSHIWEQDAAMMASAIGLIEHNEAGAADPNDPANIMGTAQTTVGSGNFTSESFEGGMVRYFRAGTGSKLEQLKSDKPGEQWETFQDRTIRFALAELGWPYSLTWKPDGMNGTQERSEIEKARVSIRDRQDLLEPVMRRIVGYAVSKAIKLKILPPYPGADMGGFLKWAFQMPPKFSIDHGRDGQSRREDFKIGLRNMDEILGEDGTSYEAHVERRELETRDLITRAQSIADSLNIPFGTALTLLQQRTQTASAPGGVNGQLLTEGDGSPPPVDNTPVPNGNSV